MSTKIRNSTDILRAAKQLLIDVGWIKGRAVKNDGTGKAIGYCAVGAVGATDSIGVYDGNRSRAYNRLDKAAGKKFHFNVVELNDHPHTSKKQILAVFDRAINSTKKSKKGSKR